MAMFNVSVAIAGLTTATTLYTDGDVLGTAPMTFNLGVDQGHITGAVIINATVNVGAVDLFLYDRSVTSAANNVAHSISDADRLFSLGMISFPAMQLGQDAFGQMSCIDSLALPFDANASNTIYGILVTRSTHTVHSGQPPTSPSNCSASPPSHGTPFRVGVIEPDIGYDRHRPQRIRLPVRHNGMPPVPDIGHRRPKPVDCHERGRHHQPMVR